MNGAGRGTLPPRRSTSLSTDPPLCLRQGRCHRHRRTPFDFRMGYGRRLRDDATVVQIDMDYRTVGKNRDISLGLVGDVGAILEAVTQAVSGRANRGINERKPWMEELRAEEDRLQSDRMAAQIRCATDSSATSLLRNRRVSARGFSLYRRWRRYRDLLRRCGAAQIPWPLDGPRPSRHVGCLCHLPWPASWRSRIKR